MTAHFVERHLHSTWKDRLFWNCVN